MTAREVVEPHHLLEGPEGAPVLVMANSLGTTLRMWENQAPALRERFRLLRYDHRGHGGSPVPSGRTRSGTSDATSSRYWTGWGWSSSPFAVSRSGGWSVCGWRARHPSASSAWCCVAPRPASRHPSSGTSVRRWCERRASAPSRTRCWSAGSPPFREGRPGTVEWGGGMLRGTPAEGYAGCCEAIRDADLRGRLGTISAATLVVAGAEDPAAPVDQAKLIRDSIPGSRLVVVEGAAHLANVERPEPVTREILAHLKPVAREGG